MGDPKIHSGSHWIKSPWALATRRLSAKVLANGEAISRVTLSPYQNSRALIKTQVSSAEPVTLWIEIPIVPWGVAEAPPIPPEVSIKMVMYLLD